MREVSVGDVYPAKSTGPGGRRDGTRYWLVISVGRRRPIFNVSCHLLGLDKNWNVISTASYGAHAMQERPLLYRIKLARQFTAALKGEQP